MKISVRYRICCLFLIMCAFVAAQAQASDAVQMLGQFVRTVQSGRAQFTQSVTPPAREGQQARTRISSGSFEFVRPNRFRFDYTKPFVQTLVADGQTLWFHDPELNQVTARKLGAALQGTPVALIASASDLRALQSDFELIAQAQTEGLHWVLATPRSREGQLQSLRIGLRMGPAGVELAALDVLDALGQRSVMRFSRFETQGAIASQRFEFAVPAGADLIRP